MGVNIYLLAALGIALLIVLSLLSKLLRVRGQLALIRDALEDMKRGNLNRRVLAGESDATRQICYDINQIAAGSQARLIGQRQAEQAYKRLMAGLSHDVKTPLASLVGYLEAIESGIVSGGEREEYLHVAFEKSQQLKHFVESLFEWVKLDAGEQLFHFERADLNELSRNILADWVPVLENSGFAYEIEIPETECSIRVDPDAYTRMLNNLLQNAIVHSGGDRVALSVVENQGDVTITVKDNGIGISPTDLPHIFERMYRGDRSRSAGGNGLGLSIVRELVSAHGGKITAASAPGSGAEFTITLPKAL